MHLDGFTLGRACARSFVGELGDKTFFLIIVLAAWCPWEGIRGGDDRFLQLCLVFGGALLAHTIMIMTKGIQLDHAPLTGLSDTTFTAAACILYFLLFMRAWLERSRAKTVVDKLYAPVRKSTSGGGQPQGRSLEPDRVNPFDETADIDEEPEDAASACAWNREAFGAATRDLEWNRDAFGGAPSTQKVVGLPDNDYGTMPQPPAFRNKSPMPDVQTTILGNRPMCLILSFFASLILVFLTESEDKSLSTMDAGGMEVQESHHSFRAEISIGSVLGFVPAVILELVIGYFLERQLTDSSVLFFVTTAFASLCIVSFSQAALHIPALADGGTGDKTSIGTGSVLLMLGSRAMPEWAARAARAVRQLGPGS